MTSREKCEGLFSLTFIFLFDMLQVMIIQRLKKYRKRQRLWAPTPALSIRNKDRK
jgi:hypothetical protein